MDLAFARVDVDKSGNVTNITLLNDQSQQVSDWFYEFVNDELRFYPASSGKVFEAGNALILVRAVLTATSSANVLTPPCLSPYVSAYVRSNAVEDLPPVTVLLLQTPSGKTKPIGGTELVERTVVPGELEVVRWDTEWSTIFGLVSDSAMPQGLRREVVPMDRQQP
jgi:hypothetical protein